MENRENYINFAFNFFVLFFISMDDFFLSVANLEKKMLLLEEKFSSLLKENNSLKQKIQDLEEQKNLLEQNLEDVKKNAQDFKISQGILGDLSQKKLTKKKIGELILNLEACILNLSKNN